MQVRDTKSNTQDMRINVILAAALVAALAFTGCKKDPFGPSHGHNNGNNENQPEEVKIVENPDWTVTYLGRADFEEADGTVSRVEEFRFKYTGNNWFIVRSLQDGVLQDSYDGSLKDFFTAEAKAVVDAADGDKWYENNNNAFDKGQTGTVAFDLLFHGNYVTYIIEMNAKGNITGQYAKVNHEVEEEVPVANYSRWIGDWKVGDGYSFFDIKVSSAENNYFYFVDGWETLPDPGKNFTQMNSDEDWIYARYNKKDGNLYFYGQFILNYDDYEINLSDNKEFGNVDEMFVGTYLDGSAGEKVDGEGADYQYDIAHAEQDGESFSIQPESFKFDNGASATYKTMRYSRWVFRTSSWAHYNDAGVPTLPLTMTRIDVLNAPAKVHRMPNGPAATKNHMNRGALKVHTPKTSR